MHARREENEFRQQRIDIRKAMGAPRGPWGVVVFCQERNTDRHTCIVQRRIVFKNNFFFVNTPFAILLSGNFAFDISGKLGRIVFECKLLVNKAFPRFIFTNQIRKIKETTIGNAIQFQYKGI